MANKRLRKLIKSGKVPIRGGVMLDCYNQRAVEDYSVTITTRINSATHYYVIEETENGKNDIEDMENEIKDTSSPKIAEPYIAAVRGREPNVLTPRRTEYGKAVRENHGEVTAVMHPKYRIRKLTPRECFRLMDVDDADIDKIQGAGICNSQQYKLAGNSIVVNVLYHIFRKMFVEQCNEEQQLKLF